MFKVWLSDVQYGRCIKCIFDLGYFQPRMGLSRCNHILSWGRSVLINWDDLIKWNVTHANSCTWIPTFCTSTGRESKIMHSANICWIASTCQVLYLTLDIQQATREMSSLSSWGLQTTEMTCFRQVTKCRWNATEKTIECSGDPP